jgi:hypothetical protein
MADPRAFISFDFDNDAEHRMLFVGQCKNSKTPFNVQDWSSKEELRQDKWEQLIGDKINNCHLMIVLVGKNAYTASGIHKEIDLAIKKNVPYFGVYINGADGYTALPPKLQRDRVISWTWDGIASAINQMMGEGKNK